MTMIPTIKKSLPFLAATLLGTNAFAQDFQAPTQNTPQPVEIQINQPFVSESLGELTLPFMWTAQEDKEKKRLIVTESRSDHPATLTIDLIKTPKTLDDKAMAQSISDAVTETIQTKAEIKAEKIKMECGKSKCPSITVYTSEFSGNENDVPRTCAMEIVPNKGNTLILSICTYAEQPYTPSLKEVLNKVLFGMK